MERDYRLAMAALGLSAVVLVASGAVVVADASPAKPRPAEDTANETRTAEGSERFNATVAPTDDGTYTVQQARRTCSGALRLDEPERNESHHRIEGVNVTVVSHHDGEPFDEIARERFARLVVEETRDRATLDEYDRLELQVNQYYETTARTEPLDTAGVHVRPADGCLPSVRGTVDLTNGTVDVRTVRPAVDEVRLNYTDEAGVLGTDDRAMIERLVAADGPTSYNVRAHLDATQLDATVTEATADGRVDIELQRPDGNGSSVMLTVDLDEGTVVQTWMVLELDASNVRMVNESAQTTDGGVDIDLDASNVTVADGSSGASP